MVGQKLEAVELLANERILSLDVKCLRTIVPILKISKLRSKDDLIDIKKRLE